MAKNNSENKQALSRKEFLWLAWGASVVAMVGQAGLALLNFIRPRLAEQGFGSKILAGLFPEFEPGTVSYVSSGRFYIAHIEDEGLLAIWDRCPHLGCTVPWKEDEHLFHCPCHSSIFNIKGEVLSGPAPRPMDIFPISVDGEEITVDTGDPKTRDSYDSSQATKI